MLMLKEIKNLKGNQFDLLDGNAQSVRYEEIIHDGSGQLDSASHQEELTGCLIELIWIPKSKSNTSTPKTNLQTS